MVMLLNVKVYILVKVEVLAVSLVLEGLQLVTMALLVDTTCCPLRRRVCKVLYICQPWSC